MVLGARQRQGSEARTRGQGKRALGGEGGVYEGGCEPGTAVPATRGPELMPMRRADGSPSGRMIRPAASCICGGARKPAVGCPPWARGSMLCRRDLRMRWLRRAQRANFKRDTLVAQGGWRSRRRHGSALSALRHPPHSTQGRCLPRRRRQQQPVKQAASNGSSSNGGSSQSRGVALSAGRPTRRPRCCRRRHTCRAALSRLWGHDSCIRGMPTPPGSSGLGLHRPAGTLLGPGHRLQRQGATGAEHGRLMGGAGADALAWRAARRQGRAWMRQGWGQPQTAR